MTNLTLTIFGVALLVASSLACSCYPPATLRGAYCADYGYLIQANIVDATDTLFYGGAPNDSSADDMYLIINNFGYRRYTLAVTQTYRVNGGVVSATSTLEAMTGSSMCGLSLQVGKTYVLEGYFHDGVMTTNACSYSEQHDGPVEIDLPDCQAWVPPFGPQGVFTRQLEGAVGGMDGMGGMVGSLAKPVDDQDHKRLTLMDLLSEE